MVLTPKAFHHEAQGRESPSAPWVAINCESKTLKGFDQA